jgi:hypothetical protein
MLLKVVSPRFRPSPHPSPLRGEGKGEGEDFNQIWLSHNRVCIFE